MTDCTALDLARAYHSAWSTGDFAAAAQRLADDLIVEVPINDYPTRSRSWRPWPPSPA